MNFKLTPIAFVISSSMLLGGMSHAFIQGNGDNGTSSPSSPSLVGSTEYGAQGTTGADADGKDATNTTAATINISGSVGSQLTFTGSPGGTSDPVTSRGSGIGGIGGASVIGGMSVGGAAGYAFKAPFTSANGGSGGGVYGNRIEFKHVTLDGSNAAGGSSSSSNANGAAGHGGGSVFGGISSGGLLDPPSHSPRMEAMGAR